MTETACRRCELRRGRRRHTRLYLAAVFELLARLVGPR
jgi:hypothetical protein